MGLENRGLELCNDANKISFQMHALNRNRAKSQKMKKKKTTLFKPITKVH